MVLRKSLDPSRLRIGVCGDGHFCGGLRSARHYLFFRTNPGSPKRRPHRPGATGLEMQKKWVAQRRGFLSEALAALRGPRL